MGIHVHVLLTNNNIVLKCFLMLFMPTIFKSGMQGYNWSHETWYNFLNNYKDLLYHSNLDYFISWSMLQRIGWLSIRFCLIKSCTEFHETKLCCVSIQIHIYDLHLLIDAQSSVKLANSSQQGNGMYLNRCD